MNKIKLITAIALIGAMLTGCAEKPAEETTVTETASQTEETTAAETTAETTAEDTVTTTETTPPETEATTAETEPLPEFAENIYQVLEDNYELFMGDNVVGVKLIDLDFDDTPELLISKIVPYETIDYDTAVDADIYRFENSELKYIDTLHNFNHTRFLHGNNIGLKITDKLEKKWVFKSREIIGSDEYNDAHYLFELNGDKLGYTELFRSDVTGYKAESDGANNWDFFFFGEQIDVRNYVAEEKELWYMWEEIIEEYSSDIDVAYNLYSDWLMDYESYRKTDTDEEALKSRLEYLVREFFLNSNENEKTEYQYIIRPT
ncbi:MAG: hypothetical protein J6A05_04730 [Oscillospiraceae bacterium]|nr:hypothetical protein [Oscillospiraceae bacterium]